jgi:hypothetical protein
LALHAEGQLLEAIPTGIFSNRFRLQQEDELLGEFDPSIWRDKARLEIEDGTHELYREGQFRGDFVLEHNGKVVARATKPSAFRGIFTVELSDRHLILRKRSVWGRDFVLFDGEKEIGTIRPRGFFRRRTNIELPGDWPLPLRIFVFWLAFLIWKRDDAAAAS